MNGRALVVILAALGFPGVASAHTTLLSASPATQSQVSSPPREIVLRFDQSVTVTPRAIEVFTVDGRVLSSTVVSTERDRVIRAPLAGVREGASYTVRWRATSSDGHTSTGIFTFGVGVTPPPPTEAYGATEPTWTDDAARWGYFLALALTLGTIGLRLLVLRTPLDARLSNRLYGLSAVGGIAVLNIGIAAFVMRAADALQVPFADLLYGDLSPFAAKTRFGVAFVSMTLGFALVTALVLLAWIFDRPGLLWPAFVTGLLFATGLSLSGHQGVEPNSTFLTAAADWLHLVAALLWVGGLVALTTCVWPLAPSLRRMAFLGFSRLATGLVAVLVLAGVYLSIARLARLSDLWSTSYGNALLVKLGIVSVALAWGAAHHFFVRPRIERESAPPGLRRSLIGESSVAILVLLLASVLVNAQPPAVTPAPNARDATSLPG